MRMKTLKPMIKDAKTNKYVLEAVKSLDPDPTYFLNFGTSPSVTFQRMKLDTKTLRF